MTINAINKTMSTYTTRLNGSGNGINPINCCSAQKQIPATSKVKIAPTKAPIMRHIPLLIALAVTTPVHAESNQGFNRVPEFEITQDHIQLNDDYGGDLDAYARAFALFESNGQEIWVTGKCLSACTMVLNNPKACAMPNAIFGFHAARLYNAETLEVMGNSVYGNRIMWAHYPDRVKQRLGGRLSDKPVYIKGTDVLPPCK
jgi:hypothetical protein